MDFGMLLCDKRKAKKLARKQVATLIHNSPRAVESWEKNQAMPSADTIVRLAEIYKAPELPQAYCKYMCAIGRHFAYVPLNNIDVNPAAILLKLQQEKREVDRIMDRLCDLVINKRTAQDFTEAEIREIEKCIQEVFDLGHVIEELKRAVALWLDLKEAIRKHNDKCLQRGYVRTKESALVGAV